MTPKHESDAALASEETQRLLGSLDAKMTFLTDAVTLVGKRFDLLPCREETAIIADLKARVQVLENQKRFRERLFTALISAAVAGIVGVAIAVISYFKGH